MALSVVTMKMRDTLRSDEIQNGVIEDLEKPNPYGLILAFDRQIDRKTLNCTQNRNTKTKEN